MPIVDENKLKSLLIEGAITALTLDTNVFDGKKLNFRSRTLKAVAGLQNRPFQLVLSGTIKREIQGHIAEAMEVALRELKKAAGDALYAFGTSSPTRGELLEQVTGGRTPSDAAATRMDEFIKDSGCEVLDDTSLVTVGSIFDAYFDQTAPFSQSKKTEFPDALALQALERTATDRKTGFLVVSKDGDWKKFCEQSQSLYLVETVETALSLINNAPPVLRKAVATWLWDDEGSQAEIVQEISNYLERVDVDAGANASYGQVEAYGMAPELKSVGWPDRSELEILETNQAPDGGVEVLVSIPLSLGLEIHVELSFSVWDSVDKESLGMGGRTVIVEQEEYAPVTITVLLRNVGETNQEVELVETELDIGSIQVDLGDVDVFEPDDYED